MRRGLAAVLEEGVLGVEGGDSGELGVGMVEVVDAEDRGREGVWRLREGLGDCADLCFVCECRRV